MKKCPGFSQLMAVSAFVAVAGWSADAAAACTVIEDFESGWQQSPWTAHDAWGSLTTAYSKSGSYGVENPDWVYRTDVTVGQQAGERLGVWFHGGTTVGGRVYLGFDADSSGAKTFIASLNTGDIRFQDNAGYNHTQLGQASQTFSSQWYFLEVEFNGGGSVTGRLYDSDGTTLINSLTENFGSAVDGGVVLRTFDGNVVDDVTHCNANNSPTAINDSYGVDEDGLLDVSPDGVLANDSDPDNDSVSASVASGPSNGTLSLSADGGFTYEPDPNFHGTDSFTYRASDGNGGSDTATVTISVGSVNDAPTLTSSPITSATEDQPYSYGVSATDVDGDSLTITSVRLPGWLSLTTGGGGSETLSGTPTNADVGTHSVELVVRDGNGGSDTQAFTIDVQNINDAPYFVAPTPQDGATLTVVEGDSLTMTLAAADDDAGDTLTYNVAPLPSGASFDSSGAFRWVPTWQHAGSYPLTLSVSDGQADDIRSITVTVSYLDNDADELPDTWETQNGLDTTTPDSDGDNIADLDEVGDLSAPADTDSDGTLDALDDDSDNDGLLDSDEAGDDDLATLPVDSDSDGTPDYRDTDSDDDTVDDVDDNCPTTENVDQADSDGDDAGDVCDDDSDNDGLSDSDETALGLDPSLADSDGDGIDDGTEVGGDVSAPLDSDGDSTIDALDDDSDDDGVLDADEHGMGDASGTPVDTDGDGDADFRDTDSDDDSVDDGSDNCRLVANTDQADADGNEIGDACDGDSDGDGVLDADDNCPTVANPEQTDPDADGAGQACDDVEEGLNEQTVAEAGCGCSSTGLPANGASALLFLFGLAALRLRRRD